MTNAISIKSTLGVTLFGSVFLAVGLGVMIFAAARPMVRLMNSASWLQCEATIDPNSVKLKSSRASKGSTTYKAQASYTYITPDGQTRSSDNVSFSSGSDNLGSWQKRTYNKLKKMSHGKTVCHVNPRDMNDVVLLREIHELSIPFSSLFGFIFACVGGGIVIYTLRFYFRERDKPENDKAVHSTSLSSPYDICFAAVPISLNLWLLFIFLTRMPDASAWIWLLLIPVVLPLLFVGHGFRMRRIFGNATFTPAETIRIGGRLTGDIRLTSGSLDENFEFTIMCMEYETTGSGKNKRTTTRTLWKSEPVSLQPTPTGDGGTTLRLATPLRDNLPQSDNSTIKWFLTLRAKDRIFPNRIRFQLNVLNPLRETHTPELAATLGEHLTESIRFH